MGFYTIDSDEYNKKENQCLLECLYWYNYGSTKASTNTVYTSGNDVVQFDNKSYQLTQVNCFSTTTSQYQLEIIHTQIGGSNQLRVIIPFSDGGATSLVLGSMSLDNIIPQDSYYYYYNESSSQALHTIFFLGENRYFKLVVDAVADAPGGLTNGDAISHSGDGGNDSRIFYNSSGTKNNNSYTSDDDIYIDCSPVGESDGEIIYTKNKTKFYFPSYKPFISSEHLELAQGIAMGLLAIALFNKAFNKMV